MSVQTVAAVGPDLRIDHPAPNQAVDPGSLNVNGFAFDRGLPEPHLIQSVTVRLDNDPPVPAQVKRIPPSQTHNDKQTTASFAAQIQIPNVGGFHEITVTSIDDARIKTVRTVRIVVPVRAKQPQRILEIRHDNPEQNVSADFAQTVAFGKPKATPDVHVGPLKISVGGPFPSVDAQQEWKQALPADLADSASHDADYEVNLVGASGWVLNPEFSNADVPFYHPFGFDWEFMLALDQPSDNPQQFTSLLTPADQSPEEDGFDDAVTQAKALKDHFGDIPIPHSPDPTKPSLFGAEIDTGLVPQQFTDFVQAGDRMAVLGRWIVDCGHQMNIPSFRTEIHPPLLMAAAQVVNRSLATPADHSVVTRVLFTSRPYLVSQRFVNPPGLFDGPPLDQRIYDDHFPDDGPFVSHLVQEVLKVNVGASTQVEAHPKIKSKPFDGIQIARFVIRPPSPSVATPHGPLMVSFQFTRRTGCAVEVISSAPDTVEVVVVLNSATYTSPPLPSRSERSWHRSELERLSPDAGKAFLKGEVLSAMAQEVFGFGAIGAAVADLILEERGIKTDEYDTSTLRSVNMLDASHAVTVQADTLPLPPGRGVLENNAQPYPIFGWLEVKFGPPSTHP